MSCDIHLVVEIQVNDAWHGYAVTNPARWRAAFAKLAGLGRLQPPIAPPRGMPEDVSVTAKVAHAAMGGVPHTESWLSSEEVAQFRVWCFKQGVEICEWLAGSYNNSPGGIFLFENDWVRDSLPAGVSDFRWVFWFDN